MIYRYKPTKEKELTIGGSIDVVHVCQDKGRSDKCVMSLIRYGAVMMRCLDDGVAPN